MIQFFRDESKVTVRVTVDICTEKRFYDLEINATSPVLAFALKKILNEQMDAKIQAMREDAYAQGWKDAKAKRAKQTYFSRWWK